MDLESFREYCPAKPGATAGDVITILARRSRGDEPPDADAEDFYRRTALSLARRFGPGALFADALLQFPDPQSGQE